MNISIEKVSKSFDKKPVLRDISMSITAGEIVCLLGPSGAGKTTLMRLLLGAISADGGHISFGDTAVPNLALLRHIGYMPQNEALYDDLSGQQNLQFFAEIYGMNRREIGDKIMEAAAVVDLQGDLKKRVKHYSGGMKKRLSLAVALLHDPAVLILDEPTVGIDPVLRRSLWDKFQERKALGRTILVSTHVMDEFSECDRAALLYDGRLIYFDTRENLLAMTREGRVEELFFLAEASTKGGVPHV